MAAKSHMVTQLDQAQAQLLQHLKPLGFVKKGRTFRRETDPGVLQIVALQAGPFELGPPLPEAVQHLRPNLYGLFTINLGVYVPEIHARGETPVNPKRVICDAHCTIRTRIGRRSDGKDWWWPIKDATAQVVDDIAKLIIEQELPFLDQFATRDQIVRDWIAFNNGPNKQAFVARLDVAMILLGRGEVDQALALFQEHLQRCETLVSARPHLRGHVASVRDLAKKIGLGVLN